MSIWRQPIDIQTLNARGKQTLAEHLQITFTEYTDNSLTATMPVDHRTQQPLGILNGGASCALAETVSSTAANFCVDQTIEYCVGLDINANHLRPAQQGLVTAITRPVHIGRRTQVWVIDIFNEEQKQICIARMTMAVVTR